MVALTPGIPCRAAARYITYSDFDPSCGLCLVGARHLLVMPLSAECAPPGLQGLQVSLEAWNYPPQTLRTHTSCVHQLGKLVKGKHPSPYGPGPDGGYGWELELEAGTAEIDRLASEALQNAINCPPMELRIGDHLQAQAAQLVPVVVGPVVGVGKTVLQYINEHLHDELTSGIAVTVGGTHYWHHNASFFQRIELRHRLGLPPPPCRVAPSPTPPPQPVGRQDCRASPGGHRSFAFSHM